MRKKLETLPPSAARAVTRLEEVCSVVTIYEEGDGTYDIEATSVCPHGDCVVASFRCETLSDPAFSEKISDYLEMGDDAVANHCEHFNHRFRGDDHQPYYAQP